MYLMNIPPVIATHTEWRTCGPPGGYSLPLGLNDSDSDLSTRGTPISDKVQMIIESLRSSQSSVEMGDEKEKKVLSAQEGHAQVCKVAMGSLVGTKSKTKGPNVNQQVNLSSTFSNKSHESDSDDSVDRGIEEAIREYLKEKDSPKRKGETCANTLLPSKIPRRSSPVPGISKLNSDSNMFLTSDEFPKSVKMEKPITPALYPIKKYIKHKTLINESSFTKQETLINPSRIIELPLDHTNKPLSDLRNLSKNLEDSDSSSDDGIEEAIQKYQMEKDQQSKKESLNLNALNEDSDSSSDDGIEEAIRRYQLEQLKEKSAVKSLLNKNKQKPVSKSLTKPHQGTTENIKKNKLKKKKNKMKKEVLSVCMPSNTFLDVTKGNGLHSFKVEGFKGQPAPPKANTTAELMCAEAILDISKTVMPGAFHQPLGLSNSSPVGSCVQSLPDNKLEDESDDSSIDSEDGIEQEIRRFLEQKAQMHKQTLSSAAAPEPGVKNEDEVVKIKDAKQSKKLSLTKKRKQKNENLSFCTVSALSNVKDTLSKTLPDNKNESTLLFSKASPKSKLQKTEQSGDKSSSLDSDEDLDTAIKDLLKTKKKLKKKTRDLKQKPQKCIKKEELQAYAFLSKKPKPDCLPEHSSLKKTEQNQDELNYSKLTKHNFSQMKCNTSKGYNIKTESESSKTTNWTVATQYEPQTVFQIKEEDSSVDSDDSIELEIRKFLAEKAKVATAEQNKEIIVSTNGITPICSETKAEDVEQENQLAEIPRTNIPIPGQCTENKPPEKKLPLLSPQCLTLRHTISPAGSQSHSLSTPACSPSLLEPADGAAAARTEPRTLSTDSGNIQGAGFSKEGGQSGLSSNITPSQSASIKWRQSLGLPITDTKIRTPFLVTSSKINDTTSGTRPYQSGINFKVQTPVSVWSSAKMSTTSFSRSTEAAVNAGFRPHALSFLSSARQHPGLPFAQRLAPAQSSQYTIEEETKSMVHISKDKSVYVELETNRTNHVQVRSRDRSEEKESQDLLTANSRERKSEKMDDKDIHIKIKEEDFIDEADYESGNESSPEKKQGLSTL